MSLGAIAERLGHPPVLALTATAAPEVRDDIVHQLRMRDPHVHVAEVSAPQPVPRRAPHGERRARRKRRCARSCARARARASSTWLPSRKRSGCTRRWRERVCRSRCTTAGARAKQREEAQDAFMSGERARGHRDERVRSRHRQARHPLHRALEFPGLAGGVLPGGRARGARRRDRPLHDPVPRRGPEHPELLPRREVSVAGGSGERRQDVRGLPGGDRGAAVEHRHGRGRRLAGRRAWC